MKIPKNFVPKCNLDDLTENALKERCTDSGLIFAATNSSKSIVWSDIYIYDASMEEPLKIGERGSYIRSFCYDPVKHVVYDAGDYRTVFNTFEGKPVKVGGYLLLTENSIFSMAYHRGEIYYASHHGGVFKLSNEELIAERGNEIIQSLFIFNDELCDATRGEFMRFTKTGEKITKAPLGIRCVAVHKDIIHDAGEYGIRIAFEDKILKKREGSTVALLSFGDKLLDAGLYGSIWDSNKCFLSFDKHITAMAAIPLNVVEDFREKYEGSFGDH